MAADGKADEATRGQAIQLLAFTNYKESGATLVALMDKSQPQAVQMAAVGTLAKFSDAEVANELIQQWPGNRVPG